MALVIGWPVYFCWQSFPKLETVPVSGAVTLNGEPFEQCFVISHRSTEHVGVGFTATDGTYELKAEPGLHLIRFEGSTQDHEPDSGNRGGEDKQRWRAFTFNVPPKGANTADFKLTTTMD